MSDEQINDVAEVEVQESVETLRQKLQDAQKAIDALASKKDELLKETKAAKEEKRKAAEREEQSRKEQETIAAKNGEFEKLYKQKDDEYSKLQQELMQTRQEQRNEKIDLAAIKVAADLAKGDAHKAELLSVFIAKTISNLADESGRVDAETLADIKKQFETDKRYSPLLGGNGSVGGSAPGNTRSAGVADKTITRQDFDALDHGKRYEFIQKGGKVV